MEIFNLTLNQMLVMFIYMAMGFLLRKTNILPENAGATMSRLETYLFLPAMNFFNQLTNCTAEALSENVKLILYGAGVFLIGLAIAQPLAALFVRKVRDNAERVYERNVYRYAMSFSNYGFIGNFIVLGILGQEGLFKYLIFGFVITLFCNSWGLFILIPKNKGATLGKSILKGFTAPPLIALIAGCIGGLLGMKGIVPPFLMSALSGASDCMGPVAMVLAGFVIGGYKTSGLLSDKKVYIASLLRLIVIPAVMLSFFHLIGTDKEIMAFILVAFASPLGLNTIIYPETYGGNPKTGASMALISNVLGVVTIPVMYYIFIVAM